ncbi:mucin-2-like [Lytechinus pictus]|uniref:mucin-2-like n=1 Tax=Lytechinus pictus TaxID=7653 RepID=UPI0030B9F863
MSSTLESSISSQPGALSSLSPLSSSPSSSSLPSSSTLPSIPTTSPPPNSPPTTSPPTDPPPTTSPPTDPPPTTSPPTDPPPTTSPSTDPPPTTSPPTDPPPTTSPSTDPPPTTSPSTDPPPTTSPPTDPPPTTSPPTDPPPTTSPPTDPPPTTSPSTDPPPTTSPSTDPPPTTSPPTNSPPNRANIAPKAPSKGHIEPVASVMKSPDSTTCNTDDVKNKLLDDLKDRLVKLRGMSMWSVPEAHQLVEGISKLYWDAQGHQQEMADAFCELEGGELFFNILLALNKVGLFSKNTTWKTAFYIYNTLWNLSDASLILCTRLGQIGMIKLCTINISHKPYRDIIDNQKVCFFSFKIYYWIDDISV